MKTEDFFMGESFLKISENVTEKKRETKRREQTGREVKAKVN